MPEITVFGLEPGDGQVLGGAGASMVGLVC